MSEEQEKLYIWLAYLKEKNLWEKPKIAYAFLCDRFYEDADEIVLFKEFLLSNIAFRIVQQIDNDDFDAMKFYYDEAANTVDKAGLACFIDSVCRLFGKTSGLDSIPKDEPIIENNVTDTGVLTATENAEPSKTAEEYYRLACQQKNNLGIADKDLYVNYMTKAAELGHIKAMQFMANCYMKGKYVIQNDAKAVELYQRLAESRDGQSCYELYRYYKNKRTDADLMMKYLKMAAELNTPFAKYDLAMEYYNLSTEEGYKKAFPLFMEAGNSGDPCAFYQLALCYRFGRGVAEDKVQMKKMLEKAAELGHSEAREILRGGTV